MADAHLRDLLYIGAAIINGILTLTFYSFFRKKSLKENPWFYFLCIALFLYTIFAVFQYVTYSYYIFEESRRHPHIVILRTLGVWAIWLTVYLGFSTLPTSFRRLRAVLSTIWYCGVVFLLIFVFGDSILLYYSGLHVNPTVLEHMRGAGTVIVGALTHPIVLLVLSGIFVIAFLLRYFFRSAFAHPLRRIFFYIAAISTVLFWHWGNFFHTLPERLIFRSFIQDNIFHEELNLSPAVARKLERFGILYSLNDFYLVNKPFIFSSSTQSLLPDTFFEKRPNILIVFLESFSARVSSVYNRDFPGLTPGLDVLSQNKNTTVFHNMYNASTPTATGLMSLLCSFYPPTSHLEIEHHGSLSGHRLQCLPDVLKEFGGYGYAGYITTVDKTYAYKDRMFGNMGVDEVFGTKEMGEYIHEKPRSWGFSDHQIFPAFYQKALELHDRLRDPFVLMLSTIDSHPPYTFPVDGVRYDDQKENVFDTFHSTDDAFLSFWNEFINGPLAENTMVVVVADHAAFPSEPLKEVFPELEEISYYDEIVFLAYVPDTILPRRVDTRASGVDFAPTLLHILDINIPNSFEGYSIFDQRTKYPSLLGIHDLGLYVNEVATSTQSFDWLQYGVPALLGCSALDESTIDVTAPLTLCELDHFYRWKKTQFQQGRFWKHDILTTQ